MIEHLSFPNYTLTIELEATDASHTQLKWAQRFDSPETYQKFQRLVTKANEENLDKLVALLSEESR